jgi:hypothetical protein
LTKAALILAGLGAVIVVLILVVGPRILRDPEVSSPFDVADADVEQDLPPDLFSSDPALLKPAAHSIVEQIVAEGTDVGMDGAPYFVELADGRYVFGHSDVAGRTKDLHGAADPASGLLVR